MYFNKKLVASERISDENRRNEEILSTYVELAEINDLMSNFEETIVFANLQVFY